MAKSACRYICTICGAVTLKYSGKCFSCQSWGTLEECPLEETLPGKTGQLHAAKDLPASETLLQQGNSVLPERISTGMQELDRVLGGGLVPASVVLVGGEPGIGKSTLMLQLAWNISSSLLLYISGEESPSQIRDRAKRLSITSGNLRLVAEVNLEKIIGVTDRDKPDIVIIDSIQTLYSGEYRSSAGTITQIRECTARLVREAKKHNFILLIIGHITKTGSLAGPKTLEHMVDTVLQFEGENYQWYRMIRSVKNRFGPTNEIGVFRMDEKGLEEVSNPSEFFISGRSTGVPGNSVLAAVEGSRALLVEVQALVSKTNYPMPQRISSGIDLKRITIILAVLEKRLGMATWGQDVFIKVAGGLKLVEPASDLAVAAAVASGLRNIILPSSMVCAGEIGLSGELRAICDGERRIREAAHLGFDTIFLPKANTTELKASIRKLPITVIGCESLHEALDSMNL